MADGASDTPKIRRSSRTRTRKKKPSQIPFGIGVLVLVVVIGLLLSRVSPQLGLFWIVGNAFGYILQKARFCFTAAMRDPYLTGTTSVSKAVLTAFALTSLGFLAIKYGAYIKGLPIPGQSYVVACKFCHRRRRLYVRYRYGNCRRMRIGDVYAGWRRVCHADPLSGVFYCGLAAGRVPLRLVEAQFHCPGQGHFYARCIRLVRRSCGTAGYYRTTVDCGR